MADESMSTVWRRTRGIPKAAVFTTSDGRPVLRNVIAGERQSVAGGAPPLEVGT